MILLGNFHPRGLCSASLPVSQPQPHPVLGSPSSPGRWVHLWFLSSPYSEAQQGAHTEQSLGLTSSALPSTPQSTSSSSVSTSSHTTCSTAKNSTCSTAKTVHAPASIPPAPTAERSQPHPSTLLGQIACLQPL